MHPTAVGSRSHDGSIDEIERAFRFAIPTTNLAEEARDLIRAIRPAPWGAEKVSGIDLTRDFYWIDDDPDDASVAALEAAGKSSRLVVASTDLRLGDLKRVRKLLGKATFTPRSVYAFPGPLSATMPQIRVAPRNA